MTWYEKAILAWLALSLAASAAYCVLGWHDLEDDPAEE